MTSFLSSRLILILLAATVGLLVLDIKTHGSFKASNTGRFLKDSGALQYGDNTWSSFRGYSQQGYRWCLKNVPVYISKIRETMMPHLHTLLGWLNTILQVLLANVTKLYGYISEQKAVFEQWINRYAPGLIDIVTSWFRQALTFIGEKSTLLVKLLLKYLSLAGQWLLKNVFTGSLSPENLQRYTLEALNTTQKLASQTFSWLNDKVITVTSAS